MNLSNIYTSAGAFASQSLWSNFGNGCSIGTRSLDIPYEVAFQANAVNTLWTIGSEIHDDWGLGIAGGSSPAVAGLNNGGYEAAFQANGTGTLWTAGWDGVIPWGLGFSGSTSPAIA